MVKSILSGSYDQELDEIDGAVSNTDQDAYTCNDTETLSTMIVNMPDLVWATVEPLYKNTWNKDIPKL